MVSIKYGMKTVWRKPAKALLYLLLLCILTGILSVGLGLYSAVDSHLAECGNYFRTIVNLEYTGGSYGKPKEYDKTLAQSLPEQPLDAVAALPGVISWEPSRSALGVVDGLKRYDPGAVARDEAILVVSNLLWDDHTAAYQGVIKEAVYAFKDVANKTVFISGADLEGLASPDALDLSETRVYVFSGSFFGGQTSYLWFSPDSIEILDQGALEKVADASPLTDGVLPEDSIYRKAALAYARLQCGLRIDLVGELGDRLPFQQEKLSLKDGRLFTAAEQGSRVCVISEWLAEKMELSVGDTLDLAVYFNSGSGIFNSAGLSMDPDRRGAYEIVGVFSYEEAYNDIIYIPYSMDYAADPIPTGSTVGQFRVDNDSAGAFCTAAEELLDDSYRLTVYNQGYEITAEPYREMLRIALIFLAVCALVIVAALMLFGYLFVARQRETARTMHALGCPTSRIILFFLAGVLLLALPAVCFGAWGSTALQTRVFSYVEEFAARYQTVDLRYSNAALTIVKNLPFDPEIRMGICVTAALAMLFGALLSCASFAALVLREKRRKSATKTHRYRGKSSLLRGVMKYPLLSLRRGGLRSAAVLCAVLLITLFLGVLTATKDSYRNQLAEIRNNTVIRGYFTDSEGLRMNDLYIRNDDVQQLHDSGIAEIDVSKHRSYYILEGVSMTADGVPCEVERIRIPQSAFAQESLRNQVASGPSVVMTDSLRNLPEFFYESDLEIKWLEGYSEDSFRGEDPAICVIPQQMLERIGGELGCKILLFDYEFNSYSYFVVGSYEATGTEETVYTPFRYEIPLGRDPADVPARAYEAFYDYDGTEVCILKNNSVESALFIQYYIHVPTGDLNEDIQFVEWSSIWSMMQDREGKYAVASLPYMQEHGLRLGDELEFTDADGTRFSYTLVGTFRGHAQELYDIYCMPKAYDLEIEWIELSAKERATSSVNSAVFTLHHTDDLEELRNTLEEIGYQKVHDKRESTKSFAVIDDKTYTETVRSLERQISYTDTLYRCLYILSALIGLIMAYLLTQSRKAEIAVMRSLGDGRGRILLVFLAEQMLLLLAGLGLGITLWIAAGQSIQPLYLRLLGAFAGCWLAGAGLCLVRCLSRRTLDMLSERED